MLWDTAAPTPNAVGIRPSSSVGPPGKGPPPDQADRDRNGIGAVLRCPYCKSNNDKVIDSRTSGEADVIRRRRECLECKGRFTTYEKVGETPLRVVKKDGTRVPWDRDKCLRGMLVACEKRPVSTERLEAIVTEVESRLHEMFDKEVAAKFIGHQVMEALREVDQVAYVRFASVYREFKDVNQFLDELKPLLSHAAGGPTADARSAASLASESPAAPEAPRARSPEVPTTNGDNPRRDNADPDPAAGHAVRRGTGAEES